MRYRTPAVRETKAIELSSFRGIDLSNPPSKVKPYRATHLKNLWNINGVNRKRPGFEQLTQTGITKFAGMCRFTLNNFDEFFVCCGSNKLLIYHLRSIKYYDDEKDEYYINDEWKLLFTETYAGNNGSLHYAISDGKAYLYGMGAFYALYFVAGGYVLRNIYEDEDEAYIPITTINIGPDDRENDIKAVAESLNRLSRFRRNKLCGTDTYNGQTLLDIEALWADSAGSTIIQHPYSKWTLDTEVYDAKSLEVKFSESKKIVLSFEEEMDENAQARFALRYVLPNGAEIDCLVGYINKGSRDLYLYFKTAPEVGNEYESNITVTISEREKGSGLSLYPQEIVNCTSSIVFGLSGGVSRIFTARGESPTFNENIIFYSGVQFETGKADFTYFPEDNTIALGDSGTGIKGLIYSNDGRLLALKDKKNNDPTVYYIDGEVVSKQDGNGNISYYREIFKAAGATIGEEFLSQKSFGNLAGDILMLSKNGVFGIVNPMNVYTSGEKAVRMRSRFVNADLLKGNLQNAVATVYDNRYFLAVDNKIYIADARYKSAVEAGDMADTFNYEWWVWADLPEITAMAVIDDQLIIGSSDGRIYKLSDDFYDCNYQVMGAGDYTAEIVSGISYFSRFALSPGFEPRVGDYFVFSHSIISLGGVEMQGKELYVVAVYDDGTSVELSDKEGGEVISFYPYEAETSKAKLFRKTAVVAEWVTPVFDMGSISKKKLLKAITVSAEKQKKATLEVGYHTRNEARDLNFNEFESKGLTYFDWSFGFDAATYDNQFTSSYTKEVRDYFNFVSFYFRSATACDMAVNALEVKYKVISDNVGVY